MKTTIALAAGLAVACLAPSTARSQANPPPYLGVSESFPTGSPAISPRGLVAAYDFETRTEGGLLRDFSGNGLHGEVDRWRLVDGPLGGARLFAEVADRVDLPEDARFEIQGPLSIAVWVRVDRLDLHQHVFACDDMFALWVTPANQVRLGDTHGGGYSTAEGAVEAGAWTSVVAVLDATRGEPLTADAVRIYLNGAPADGAVHLRTQATGQAPRWAPTELYPDDACYIGFESHQGDPAHQELPFVGAIDDALVFARALSADEARAHASRHQAAATPVVPSAVGARAPSLVTRVTNAYPAYAPDGERIAYMSNADGDFDLYVVDLGRGERRRLTDAPDRDGTPAWSPDGRRIAFQSFRDGHSQIYVMDADGGNVRNLSNGDAHDEHPFWSPDGQTILFVSDRDAAEGEEPSFDLYVMNADGSGVRRLTSTPETETYASWSPDGTRIVCRRIEADGNWEVVVLDADGSTLANLSRHPGFDGWPFWSPDGERVVFSSERSGSADLWIVDADGSNLDRLTDDPEADERQPWWSPDGRRIAYARYVWFPDEPFYEASEILEVEVPTSSRRPAR